MSKKHYIIAMLVFVRELQSVKILHFDPKRVFFLGLFVAKVSIRIFHALIRNSDIVKILEVGNVNSSPFPPCPVDPILFGRKYEWLHSLIVD